MVCQFLLYNKVNQLYIYIYPHISSLCVSLSPSLFHPSRWSQSTELITVQLCYAAASHYLFYIWWCIYVHATFLRYYYPLFDSSGNLESMRTNKLPQVAKLGWNSGLSDPKPVLFSLYHTVLNIISSLLLHGALIILQTSSFHF